MPMNAWLRHLPAAVNPELEDAWLERLGLPDRVAPDEGRLRPVLRPAGQAGAHGTPVGPVPRGPASRPHVRR